MIKISPNAEQYLAKLKSYPENANKELRLSIIDPDTIYAESVLEFVVIGPEHGDDIVIGYQGFQLFIDSKAVPFLEGAEIALEENDFSKKIVVHTPHLKPFIEFEGDLWEKTQFILENYINPQLAMHGGYAKLIEINKDNFLLLEFGGGCQGCSQVGVTLKQGIEQNLLQMLPEIKGIIDVTMHEKGINPFYG